MKAGVHLANDGNVTEQHLQLIRNLPMVKGMIRLDCDWDEIDYPRLAAHLRPDCDVVLRLFFPGKLEAAEFVERSRRKLPDVLNALAPRTCWIEIHNEPNHCAGIEGWGNSDEQAADFAAWYCQVLNGLRDAGFGNLGFPGLAVGEWAHRERSWAIANKPNMKASDWIGVHCYWQTAEQIEHPDLGLNWKWYRERFPHKRLIVTEAGNSGCDGPMGAPSAEAQAAQYVSWCKQADVYGVAFFILGGTEHWKGFQIHPQTIWGLEGI